MQNRGNICRKDKTNVSIDKILSNPESIHLFMLHLSKEYSMECLLSLIEIMQFKNYVRSQLDTDFDFSVDLEHERSVDPELTFASNIPISEIIEAKEDIQEDIETADSDNLCFAKIKAHKIYNKYIKWGSEFEINIALSQRTKIANILHDFDRLTSYKVSMEDLYLLFDEAQLEMMNLLNYSLGRLKGTPDYANILLCFTT